MKTLIVVVVLTTIAYAGVGAIMNTAKKLDSHKQEVQLAVNSLH